MLAGDVGRVRFETSQSYAYHHGGHDVAVAYFPVKEDVRGQHPLVTPFQLTPKTPDAKQESMLKDIIDQLSKGQFPREPILEDLHLLWTLKTAMGCTLVEYNILYAVSKAMLAKNILEIGPGSGGSSASMLLGSPEAKLAQVTKDEGSGRILVDPKDSPRITTHYMTSDQFFAKIHDEPPAYDLAFIDGDHTVDGSRRDITHAMNHLLPGGVLMAHDIFHVGSYYIGHTCLHLASTFQKTLLALETNGNGIGIIY